MFKRIILSCKNDIGDKSLWFSFLAGLSLVFSYAPFSLWWVSFLVLPIWLVHLQNNIVNQEGKITRLLSKHFFIFALGWFSSGISWVHVSIAEFGGMPLVASLFIMLLLCLYLALFPAFAGYLIAIFSPLPLQQKLKSSVTTQLNLWFLPSIWLFTEYLRGVFLTGFPWLSLGYGQIDGPLSALAPVIGQIGITFCLLMCCVSIAQLCLKTHIKRAICILFIICFSSYFASQKEWVQSTGKTINTALVQGNIAQSIKWEPEQQWPTMLKYLDLSRKHYDAKLIIWPESAIPAIETMTTTQEFLDIANKSAALNNAAIITGIINYNFESKSYYNSLVVLGKKNVDDTTGNYYYNNPNRYYKNHLLPIGEFVPFQELLRPIAPLFNLPMSSFTRGAYVQKNLVANDLQILPLICFEIAFPEQLAANFSEQSDILLTVSNDAWFGNSHGPHQHMEIARMRALEFGRPLLRTTNNGVTAVTDHKGNIINQAPQFEQYVIKTTIELVKGTTPYSRYGHFSIWLLALLIMVFPLTRKLIALFKNKNA